MQVSAPDTGCNVPYDIRGVRGQIRYQKKQNKKLNKEQQRLVREMEGLHENLENLKELEAQLPKPSLGDRFKNLFKKSKKASDPDAKAEK